MADSFREGYREGVIFVLYKDGKILIEKRPSPDGPENFLTSGSVEVKDREAVSRTGRISAKRVADMVVKRRMKPKGRPKAKPRSGAKKEVKKKPTRKPAGKKQKRPAKKIPKKPTRKAEHKTKKKVRMGPKQNIGQTKNKAKKKRAKKKRTKKEDAGKDTQRKSIESRAVQDHRDEERGLGGAWH